MLLIPTVFRYMSNIAQGNVLLMVDRKPWRVVACGSVRIDTTSMGNPSYSDALYRLVLPPLLLNTY